MVGLLLLVEAKLVILVVELLEVEQDGCSLKNREVVAGAIDKDRDTSVRV